jgi:hypothetical protein
MARNFKQTGLPDFFVDSKSPEKIRKQFIDGPAKAAQQAAFAPALELVELFSLLPDAFAKSQKRELERLKSSAEDNDPRVAALEASIARAETMISVARRGEMRVQRSLMALAMGEDVFHGFVSDTKLNPLEGLTVQVSLTSDPKSKKLSATTEEDGYFRIPLGKRSGRTNKETEEEAEDLTPEKIAELLARQKQDRAGDYQPGGRSDEDSFVQIFKKSHLLHEDPVAVELGDGSVYREYVISGEKPSEEFDFEEFVSSQSFAAAFDRQEAFAKANKEPAETKAAAARSRGGAKKKTGGKKKAGKGTKK